MYNKDASVWTLTLMNNTPLNSQMWAFTIYLLTAERQRICDIKLHRDLDITQKSAWFLAHWIWEVHNKSGLRPSHYYPKDDFTRLYYGETSTLSPFYWIKTPITILVRTSWTKNKVLFPIHAGLIQFLKRHLLDRALLSDWLYLTWSRMNPTTQ